MPQNIVQHLSDIQKYEGYMRRRCFLTGLIPSIHSEEEKVEMARTCHKSQQPGAKPEQRQRKMGWHAHKADDWRLPAAQMHNDRAG